MATDGSKGNRKRHSPLQKEHYKAHYYKLPGNKIEKLRRHIRRNAYMIRKKASRGIKRDQQAIDRLRELAGKKQADSWLEQVFQ